MKIYSRRKLIIGLGLVMMAVVFIFTTVLSGRINMVVLIAGAISIIEGINAIYGSAVTDARKADDPTGDGKAGSEALEAEAKAAKWVLFAIQIVCIIASMISVIVYTFSETNVGESKGIGISAAGILMLSFPVQCVLENIFSRRRKDEKDEK